jgi:signal transduction histidine kinase/CheY-like chemotaxis protein/tetratricopeptide (TPR) repeat protein
VALARVRHPRLPEVLEVGDVDGLPYLVMDLVEGTTLAARLAEGAIGEDASLEVARQLASVLEAVNDAGLVHRDVKPRNIVVDRLDGGLKLVDFGFATPMERVGADAAGTAAYAAPEQLVPPGRVDQRADLYAVGRVLFECLTGQAISTRIDGPWGPAAVSELVAHGVTPSLAQVVGGLLRQDPAHRYPTAHSLAHDLDRVAAGHPPLGPVAHQRSRVLPPLVVRRGEAARVHAACRDVANGGALVMIGGARGSGKSIFLASIESEARSIAHTLSVASFRDDAPLATLRRVFDSYFDEHADHAQAGRLEAFRAAVENLTPVARLIAPERMEQIGGVSSERSVAVADLTSSADSVAEGAAQILLGLAERVGPLVIVLDDAQWIDPASAEALVRVAYRAAHAPISIVAAARSERPNPFLDRLGDARPRQALAIELGRIAREDVRQLIAAYLNGPEVDPALVTAVDAMADGTPLGVFEVLGSFLDARVVRPHARCWHFDPARVGDVILPRGALVLLGHRIADLPPATRRILEVAAVIGRSFSEELLTRVVDIGYEDLGFGLASARRAGLIELEDRGDHRFVHDSVREMLLEALTETDLKRTHQGIGEVLEQHFADSSDTLYAAAVHLSAGLREADPARWYRVARAAGSAALARFDNETALRFLSDARTAAQLAGIGLDVDLFRQLGEAHVRLGAIDESLQAFEEALRRATSPETRAAVLGRISWVHQNAANPERAWQKLSEAFAALGGRLPSEKVSAVVRTSVQLARSVGGRYLHRPDRGDVDLLCELHYQNARLGMEYGKPARVIQSALQARVLSERSASPATRARARAAYAFVITALGRTEAGGRELEAAKKIAAAHDDAAATAFCVGLQATASCWAGDFDGALVLSRECTDVHGPWLELNEYVQLVANADIIQSMRGRANEAWGWGERATNRLRRSRFVAVVRPLAIHRARAALAAIGREVKDDPWLAAEIDAISPRDAGEGYHRMLCWGPRARYYLERGELGDVFDELVRSFEGERTGAGGGHAALVEYYVAVAHARIHQCLGASPGDRARRLADLKRAAGDLAKSRMALVKAHHATALAYVAFFEGKSEKMHEHLAQAAVLGNEQSAPWVLYALARLRAHALRQEGRMAAALDQARMAEFMAREHGAVPRARLIQEEFGLAESRPDEGTRRLDSNRRSSSSRANRQLATFLQIARAPRMELKLQEQAEAILDELIEALDAERGAIWFQPNPGNGGITVARHRASESSVSLAPDSARGALLRDVGRRGSPWPPTDGTPPLAPESGQPFDGARVTAVPLVLYDRPAGALCIERGDGHPKFDQEDRNLLLLLSHQVPIALELARVLVEREQLHASLQHAKKMEAMGTLAGGLAHDFNNMLAAMKVALGVAQERAALDSELTAELDVIAEATTRASQLTSQLLSFSRHQPMSVGAHDVNQLVSKIEPMLRRVVGAGVDVVVKLSPAVDAAEVDQGGFDQALVNLLLNARDAMPKGGTLTIATRNVVLGPAAAQRANVPPGEFVEVEVSDTGTGMTTDVMSRIFEPFYTTKPSGAGSGLGLAMVYAFARNSGGSIEVSSDVGKGTQFRLYFRRREPKRTSRPAREASVIDTAMAEVKTDGPDTILVVDDDDLVRRSIAKILERHGYRVIAARGSDEALDLVEQQGARIALVILDVLMPGISGPELGRRLSERKLPAKLLFVSGFSPESIPFDDAKVAAHMLLQKPFSQTALLERVRHLIYS